MNVKRRKDMENKDQEIMGVMFSEVDLDESELMEDGVTPAGGAGALCGVTCAGAVCGLGCV
jgi:hypothetical protein